MDKHQVLRRLRLQWFTVTMGVAVYLFIFSELLTLWWQWETVTRWLVATSAVCIYLLAVLWFALPENHRKGETSLLPNLGAGNLLTLSRGILFSGLAGFAVSPLPQGTLEWLPGCIYIIAAIADLFDGYLARRGNHVTGMGERLDMTLDGAGVLLASYLLFHYQKLPCWILLVGVARYVFISIEWMLTRLGKPTHPLPQSQSRRGFAGAVMGFLGTALLPVFNPPITVWAGWVFVTPFLLGFVRDIMTMSGVLFPPSLSFSKVFHAQNFPVDKLLIHVIPLLLRGMVFILTVIRLTTWGTQTRDYLVASTPLGTAQEHFVWVIGFYILGTILVCLGIMGRMGGIMLMLAVGLQHSILPIGIIEGGIFLCAAGIFFLGSGSFSIWTPEQRLIERRLGEK